MRHFLFLIVMLLFTLRDGQAQEIWDWQKCVNHIKENHLQLKMNIINEELARLEVKRNQFNYTPNINATSNYNLNIGNTYNFFENRYKSQVVHNQDLSLGVQQPVFDGFQTKHQVAKAKIDLEALKLDNQTQEENLYLQVFTVFLNILNAKEQLQQNKQQQLSTLEQKNKSLALYEAGVIPESNLYDIEAQIANEEATIIAAKNQVEVFLLQLKVLLQIDVNKQIDIKTPKISDSLDLVILTNAKNIYAIAIQNRPEIKALEHKIASAKKSIAIAKSGNYPSIDFVGNINTFYTSQNTTTTQALTGNFTPIGFVETTMQTVLIPETRYISNKTPYFKQLRTFLGYTLGLGLRIPIYNKNSIKFATQQAELNVKLNEFNKQQSEYNLSNTIQQAYIKAITAKENYLAAKYAYEVTKKSYQTTEEKVAAEIATPIELTIAKNNLLQILSRVTQSKYEYIFNTKLLDYYQGKEIKLE